MRLDYPFGLNMRVKKTGYVGVCTGAATYDDGTTSVLLESLDTAHRPVKEWCNVDAVEVIGSA